MLFRSILDEPHHSHCPDLLERLPSFDVETGADPTLLTFRVITYVCVTHGLNMVQILGAILCQTQSENQLNYLQEFRSPEQSNRRFCSGGNHRCLCVCPGMSHATPQLAPAWMAMPSQSGAQRIGITPIRPALRRILVQSSKRLNANENNSSRNNSV